MITATQYLNEVQQTVCSLGHRDNQKFQEAVEAARRGLALFVAINPPPSVRHVMAKEVRNILKDGLALFMPGAQWFDSTTAIQYACLLAKFNSVSQYHAV